MELQDLQNQLAVLQARKELALAQAAAASFRLDKQIASIQAQIDSIPPDEGS